MVVLHAAWQGGRLVLWGETPADPGGVGRRRTSVHRARPRAGRAARAPRPARSPFDAGPDLLLDVIPPPDPGGIAPRADTLTAWLPTVDGSPVPSSPLVGDVPPAGGSPVLAPWAVTACPLAPVQAIELLSAAGTARVLVPGVVVASDLAFWAEALRFAASLTARERVLPGIDEAGGVCRARWTPVVTGEDAGRLHQLAGRMPDACRALAGPGDVAPPSAGPESLLLAFLADQIDALMRASAVTPGAEAARARRSGGPSRPAAFPSLDDQWLAALHAPDGTLEGSPADLHSLATRIQEWRRPVAALDAAPFRLCFRLEEPDVAAEGGSEDGEADIPPDGVMAPASWRMRYLLQSAADPSLLVPASDVWSGARTAAAVFRRAGFDARAHLLEALGQAAGLSPRIEASLRDGAPGGYDADTAAAYEFLTETAWALEEAGYGVILPSWWTRKGARAKLALRARVSSPAAPAGLSLETLVEVDWEAALGEQALSRAELDALARLKSPLVRLRGEWIQGRPRYPARHRGARAPPGTVSLLARGSERAPGARTRLP